jgi:hypothetical protein
MATFLRERPPIPDRWMPTTHGSFVNRGGKTTSRGRGAGGYSPEKRKSDAAKLDWNRRQNERKFQDEEDRMQRQLDNDALFEELIKCREEIQQRDNEDIYQARAQEQSYLEEIQRQKQKRKQIKGYQIHFII